MKWKSRAIDTITRVLSFVVTSLFAGMAVVAILQVVLRYFFNSSIPGGNEALRFAFIYTTFLGAAILVGRQEHIAIHLATRRMPNVAQRAIGALCNWLIIAMHIYLLILSLRWLAISGANMAEELKFPLRFVQMALPIGAGLASLYALNNSIDAIFDPDWCNRRHE
jgi:TRAP-type C4-dicarboxylate transport system permease small subunit